MNKPVLVVMAAGMGTARLLMGIPFWALAIWVSYLIVATPMHRHKMMQEVSEDDAEAAQTTEMREEH